MTTDLEQRLRVAFGEDAQHARLANPEGPVDRNERPPASHQGTHTAGWLVAAAVLIVAGVVGVLLIRDGGEGDREVTTSPGPTPRNGSIVTGDGEGWPAGAAAPTRPDDAQSHVWNGFDSDSGSFLYVSSSSSSRVWVLDEDGEEVADVDCGSRYCGDRAIFGPGVDEVTLFMFDGTEGWADPDGLKVVAWDGTVRDTLGISAAFTEDANGVLEQELAAVAWSPDGTRLAVVTVPKYECDPLQDPCAAQVWTFDRDGNDPQLVYTEPSDGRVDPGSWGPPEMEDLAWSPDGRSLGVVVVPLHLGRPTWPRLDVLRFQPDGTVRTETLYDYDRTRPADSTLVQSDKGTTFAFAWSPDGTRIAVAGESGVEEISAEDGQVLARHPGLGVDGHGGGTDLAWLPPA
jgi:WD40-like Beta Propeller Repeat